jgi:hypothetical protein
VARTIRAITCVSYALESVERGRFQLVVAGSSPGRGPVTLKLQRRRLDKEMGLKSLVHFRRRCNFVRVNFVRVGSGEGRMGPGRGSSSTLI